MPSDGYNGFQRPGSGSSEFNAISFLVQALMGGMATATLVKIMGVTNAGGIAPVGTVDILPLVNQVDGIGTAVPHGTVYKCPYMRLQGGANAIILDPQVGDIGIAVFADRDISSASANKGQANPGSSRRFDMADGLYIGGTLNGAPTQYVQFSTAGIRIHSPTQVWLDAADVRIDCQTLEVNATTSATITTPTFTVNGNQISNGNVTATGTVLAPILNGTTQVVASGKDIGPLHEHDHGTMTASGHTGTVI
jgi:hypothetical protein